MTGRYQAYPKYSDSNISWVGDIPSHWEVKPAFSVFKEEQTKNTDGKETNVLSLSYGNIIKRDVETNFGLLPESFNTYQLVNSGDLILRLTDLQNDKRSLRVGLSKQRGIITSAYMKLVAQRVLDSDFAYRLLHSYDTTKVFYGLGGGLRQSMKFEDFRRLPIIVPPINEQVQIAQFLDQKITKIEQLISKQEKLIELLTEKRQAVISHAVTKGLNPDATMKGSGTKWLGEVPEHWDLKPLRHLGTCQNGINIGASFFGSGFPFFSYGDVYKNGKLPLKGSGLVQSSKNDRDNYSVKEGDVFFTRTSETIDDIGLASTAFTDVEEATFAGFLIRFRPAPNKLLKEFSHFYFRNPLIQSFFVGEMNLVTRASLSQDLLKKLMIAVPPIEEQQEIAKFLEERICKIDKTIENATRAIDLLHQKKASLISAAVTGKIDVRNWNSGKELSA